MKLVISTFLVVATLAACNNSDSAKTETTTDSSSNVMATDTTAANSMANTPMPDSATMMKNWEAYMTTGEPHKLMASWNGTWTGDITMWQAPGAPPQTSKGTAVNTMALGGRYQLSKHTGNMMGMPFEGQGTLAYDNIKKKFVNTWIDNMGTGIMVMEGPWDEASKTLSLTGNCIDPMTGKDMTLRETFKIMDDKTHIMEMYGPGPDGKEFKMMEIKMTRK